MKRNHTLSIIVLAVLLVSSSARVIADTPPHESSTDVAPALYLPLTAVQAQTHGAPRPLIVAFVPDGLAWNDVDEAIAIQNTGANLLNLAGWHISDGESTLTLPELMLAAGEIAWCTREAVAFEQQWGFLPDCEYESDSHPDIPNATGGVPRLSNTGDEIVLLLPGGSEIDSVIYGSGEGDQNGWQGPALSYYQRNTRFAKSGQMFYRLFDPVSQLPWPDTDTATDWAQGNTDPEHGRRAAYPGWDLYTFSQPAHVVWSNPPAIEVLITPDNSYEAVRTLFAGARRSVLIETYEFEHPGLVALLVERAQAGVDIRMLLEGAPAGGLSDETRWAAQQISQAGGQVHFMVNDVEDAHDRYPYQHAKFAIVDNKRLLISSENFTTTSFPPDAADGETQGRRGYAFIVQDDALVTRARALFESDDDLAHLDIFPWQAGHEKYGAPPPGFTPPVFENANGYVVRRPIPLQAYDATEAYLLTSPESSLTPGPLLDLLHQTQTGDLIYTQQLYEHTYWGAGDSNAIDDPNPRLEALINAARRGATVRILLDSFFDYPGSTRSNAETITYVNSIANMEGLDLQARVGNPTDLGIHAKLHLVKIGNANWSVIGSINGSEVSNKLNREIALAVRSPAIFDYLTQVFEDDWKTVETVNAIR